MQKYSINEFGMMTRESLSGYEKSFDSGPEESQGTRKEPQDLELKTEHTYSVQAQEHKNSCIQARGTYPWKLIEGSLQGKPGWT